MANTARYGEREDRAAERRGIERAQQPTALIDANLDEAERAVRLRFRNGIELAVPVGAIAEITHAPLAKLHNVVASPLGDGLIFDDADVAMCRDYCATSSAKRSPAHSANVAAARARRQKSLRPARTAGRANAQRRDNPLSL
jgi:hypothetical protein